MEIDPGMSALLGLVVWALGLVYKWGQTRRGWTPDSSEMVWVVVSLSVVLGLVQALMQNAVSPVPAPPVELPDLVFVWIPRVVAWLAATVAAVFAASQGIYVFVRRVLFGRA